MPSFYNNIRRSQLTGRVPDAKRPRPNPATYARKLGEDLIKLGAIYELERVIKSYGRTIIARPKKYLKYNKKQLQAILKKMKDEL